MALYLVKDNNQFISRCKCDQAPVGRPCQMACPWCGCGWLFYCLNCREPFTFARAVMIEETLDELACRDYRKFWDRDPSREELRDWRGALINWINPLELGQQYIYLDGQIFVSHWQNIEFDGLRKSHNYDILPHLATPEKLSEREFWERSSAKQRHDRVRA